MRLVDADTIFNNELLLVRAECYDAVHAVIKRINNAPTVDAVEVVRCKDCKYYNLQHHYCEGIGNWFGIEGEWSDNGYCYKGERRENESGRD